LARTAWAPGAAALALAAQAVDAVISRGESADVALAQHGADSERAVVWAIALGTLRWYLRLAPAVELLLARPAELAPLVRSLLVTAAHQLQYSRNVPEMTVNAAVDAVRILKAPRAAGLVNAVLRRFLGEREQLLRRTDVALSARSAHPAWLIERIAAAWPSDFESILEANNRHPPMTLRIDLSRISRQSYREQLAQSGIESQEIRWIDSGLTLGHPVRVEELPGFSEGLVSVQDAGAQLAAWWLGALPGLPLLDACAAPGGKTCALLERLGPSACVTALDVEPVRAAMIDDNLKRLRRCARVVVADARDVSAFWDGQPYGGILVDAPCSSTGVIRRHPDIKLLRRPSDVGSFASLQLSILAALVPLLATGGRLLYSTCSILPEENQEVVGRLLASHPQLRAVDLPPPSPPGARACAPGWQLLPGAEAGTDGFYYACIEKTTAAT
jgi:16S rRNA (cytosine967-C5)-methyltransferase